MRLSLCSMQIEQLQSLKTSYYEENMDFNIGFWPDFRY